VILEVEPVALKMRNLSKIDDLRVTQSKETGDEDLGFTSVWEIGVAVEIHPIKLARKNIGVLRFL
jgi:hypothetical protein